MSFRDSKLAARRIVHAMFAVPARYYAPDTIDGVDCTVRVLDVTLTSGDVENMGWARKWASDPNIVFLAEEVIPARKGRLIVFSDDERTIEESNFVVEAVQPVYGETVTAECLRK
jgi:hypothetical protein